MKLTTTLAPWSPAEDGPVFAGLPEAGLEVSGVVVSLTTGWQSNGGLGRGHPARRLPHRLVVPLPDGLARVHAVTLVGVFALYARDEDEPAGSLGASVTLEHDAQSVARFELVNRRHYGDARSGETGAPRAESRLGDGMVLEVLGTVNWSDQDVVLSALHLELETPVPAERLVFRDLGTPASFVVGAVLAEGESVGCPFGPRGDAVPLSEVPGVVRLGDRLRLRRATDDVLAGLRRCGDDLDEARSLALTYLAVVLAGLVERGDSRGLHRALLDVARDFERVPDLAALEAILVGNLSAWTELQVDEPTAGPDRLMDRALQLLDRQFARPITDGAIARQLGLSTSHFRHLFRQVTGQPFHRYLQSLRLERARELLSDDSWSVAQVSQMVGFASAAHFSRAYTQRFGQPPSGRRRGLGSEPSP